jgi:iron complex outermembrane receptor protein
MHQLGITNIEEVANNVANFTVQNLGPGQSARSIRGVSWPDRARPAGREEQVGAYLDSR